MEKLEFYLNNLCATGMIEFKKSDRNSNQYYIPYIMNDAVEKYIVLNNTVLQGKILDGYEIETYIDIAQSGNNKKGLIVHQGEENIFTLWYESYSLHCECYKYHKIGHFWRSGDEQWRRIVYIVGTIFEKYKYAGAEYCNSEEIRLMNLLGFVPLRNFSPIKEKIDIFYEKSDLEKLDGQNAILYYAKKAGMTQLESLIRLYGKIKIRSLEKVIENAIRSRKAYELYKAIIKDIDRASDTYKEREYDKPQNEIVECARKNVDNYIKNKGYCGKYPYYNKKNIVLVALEEQPYVISELEYKNISFGIHLMYIKDGKCRVENVSQ